MEQVEQVEQGTEDASAIETKAEPRWKERLNIAQLPGKIGTIVDTVKKLPTQVSNFYDDLMIQIKKIYLAIVMLFFLAVGSSALSILFFIYGFATIHRLRKSNDQILKLLQEKQK